jgi:hypothetical protein
MKIENGDRIRFLNEVGGGLVTRIEGSLVFVEDEDGFEVPVSASEVVVVEKASAPSNSAGASSDRNVATPQQGLSANEDVSVPEAYSDELEDEEQDDFHPRFYMAYIKTGNNQTDEGKVQSYIINDSNYYCCYLISSLSEDGYMHALHQGLIEPNTKLPLDEKPARELDVTFDIQLILFKKGKPYPAVAPVSTSLNIKARRFYKENSFRANDFFYQPAVLFSIIKNELEKKMDLLTEKETNDIIREKERGDQGPLKAKRKSTPELLEVDLHINELIDSVAGLSNSEILQIQMDKFHTVMEENKNLKGRRIVFIHGVGSGTLKTELRKQLDRKYKGLNYQDASFREYGYGATMVMV